MLAMDSTFVLKISTLYAELRVSGIKKTESLGFERLIFLLIHFLSPYFQPAGTLLQKQHVTLPTPLEDDYKRLAAGTDFR
jgi:hypothetical protein